MEITIAEILEIYKYHQKIKPIFSSRTYIYSNYYGGLINTDSGYVIFMSTPIYKDSTAAEKAMNKLKAKIIAIVTKYNGDHKVILDNKTELQTVLKFALGEPVTIVSTKSLTKE